MVHKIRSFFVAAIALAASFISSSALAETPEPIAVWCGDGLSSTEAQNGLTLNLNGNNVSDGVLTIGNSGVYITHTGDSPFGTNTDTQFFQAIVKYSDLTAPTEDNKAVVMVSLTSGNNDYLGNCVIKDGKVRGIWGGKSGTEAIYGQGNGSGSDTIVANRSVPSLFSTSYTRKGDAKSGYNTTIEGVHGFVDGGHAYGNRGLKAGYAVQKIYIGGRCGSNTVFEPATGMKIYGIALFTSPLTSGEIANYKFPSDVKLGADISFTNDDYTGNFPGAGDYAVDQILIPASESLPAGTVLSLKKLTFALEATDKAKSNTITVNGVTSETVVMDGSKWVNSSIPKIVYNFENGVDIMVGTAAPITGFTNSRLKVFGTDTKNDPGRCYIGVTHETTMTNGYRPAYIIDAVVKSIPTITTATVTVNTDEQQTWTWGTLHWDVTPTKALKAEITVTGSNPLTISPSDDTDAVAKSITFKGGSSVQFKTTGRYDGGKITSEIPLVLEAATAIDVDAVANDLTYSCIGEISPAISTTGNFTKGGAGTLNIPDALNPASITVEKGVAKFTANSSYGKSKLIKVLAGGQVDCAPNGSKSQWKYEIAGFGPNNTGALIVRNTGSNGSCNVGEGALTLTADASINVPSGKTWYFVSPDYHNNTIELNNHTLSLVGAGVFSLSNTTAQNGTIEVKSGTLSKNSGRTWTFSNVNLILDGGTIDVSSALTAGALTYSSGSINTPNNLTVSTKVICDGAAIPVVPAGDYSVEIKGTVVANNVLNNLEKTIKLVNGETETDVATLDCAGITLPLAGTITADSTGTIELPSGYKSGRIAKYAGETKPQYLEFMQGETSFTADVKVIDGYLVVEGPSATISTAECSWSELFAGKTIEPGVSVELTMAIAASTLTIPEDGVSLDNLTLKGQGALTIVGGNIRCTDIIKPNGVDLTFNNEELNFYVPAGIVKTIDMVIAGTTKVNKTGEGKLILTGANTFSGGLVVTTGIVTRSGGNNASSAFGAANTTIDVKNGATIDWAETQKVNGNQYNLKIAGEGVDGYAFTTSVDSSLSGGQFYPITLELSDDATVGGAGETANRCGVMKYVGKAFVATTANLNGHTLTKKGDSEFALSKVVFSGNGKVVIDGGFLGFYNPGGEFADGISVEMNHAGKNLYLYNEAKFSELVSKNAQALADGTVIIGKSVKGAFTAKKITLDSGATVDVTDGIVTLSENVVTLGNSLTVVVGSSLDEGDSVKIFGGSFAYEVVDSVALTVKVGEQVQEGDYGLEKRNDGVYLVRLSKRTWTGTKDANWNDAENWSPTSIPTANDDVIISKDANITVSGSPTARSIAIGGNVTLSGIANNGTVGNISIALNKQLTIDVGSGNTVNCTDVSGQGTLVKTGAGTLHANASTGRKAFDGGVAVLVNAGTVEIEGTAGIGSVAFTIADGATLDCYGWLAASGTWSISNDANVSVFNNSRGGNCAVISDSGAFTKLGAGELTFKSALGDSGNKYTGAVNVNAGTLTIAPRTTGDNFNSYVSGATIVNDGATLKTANNDATFDSGSNRLQSGGTLEIAGGTTKFKSDTNKNGLCGTLKIDRGATFENTVTDSLYYDGTPTVDVYGTLNMASTRWSVGEGNTINLHAGSVVQGAGQSSNGALDFISDNCKLNCLSCEGVDEPIDITCAIRLRSNLTIDVEEGVLAKLNCSAFNHSGGKKPVFKAGDGVLEVGCDITGGCNQFEVNDGTLKVATGAVLPDAVVASGTTLDISAITGGDASSVFTGDLTMNDGMAVVFPAGYDTTQPFTLCTGTIVHDGDTIDIVVGGDSATATISDGNKITVTYTSTSWTGAAGDSLWGTAGNWTHGVPTEGMSAIIEAKSYVMIVVNGSYHVKDLHITGEPDPGFGKLVYLTDEGYDNSTIEVADHKIYTTSTLYMTVSNPLLGDENTFFLDDDAHVYYSSGETKTTVKGIYGSGKFDANSSIVLTSADEEDYAVSDTTIISDLASIEIASGAKLKNVEFDFKNGCSATALGALTVDGTLAVIGNGRLEVNGSINGTDTAISGNGTIVYNGALPGNENTSYTDTENWTGTVWLKNKTGVNDFHFENYGNANSKIKLTGISGYAPQASNPEQVDCPSEVILEDNGNTLALTLADGYSTSSSAVCTYTFAKITGSGTIKDTKNKPTPQFRFVDVSGFTGTLYTQKMRFVIGNGSGIADSGTITIDAGATATIAAGKTWTATSGIIVNGAIAGAGTLGSNTTFGNGATIDASAAQLSVAANKTLTFGDTLTVKLSSAPTDAAPVKFLKGSFTEQTFDTALTVMVGDETITGDFLIKQDANGVWAIVNADAEWKGGTTGAETDWNTASNWSKNKVPTAASRVTIPDDANISLTSTSIAASITLSGSATLTMDGVIAANIKNIAIPADETLTINVESGKTATVGLISGAGAVAKTGAGMLTLSGANTFAGGMEIVGGTAKANVGGTATSSAVGTGTLVIDTGATFDIGGQQFEQNGQGYTVESAGTITNSGANRSGHDRCIKNLTLTGNTSATGNYWVIGTGNGGGKTTLNMNGFTLTVAMNGGNNLSLEETEITGGGLIDIQSGRIRTNGKETYADGKIKMNGGRIEINTTAGAAMSVKDFEFLSGGFDGNIKMVVTGKFEGSGTLNHIKLADGVHIPVTSELTVSTSLELAGSIVIDLGEEESKSGTYRVLAAPNNFEWDLDNVTINPAADGWEKGLEGKTLVISKHALNANIEAVDGYNFGEQVIAVEVTTIDSRLKGTQIKVVTTDKTGTPVGEAVLFPIDGKENDTYDVVIGELTAGQKYNFAVTFVDANGDKIDDSYEGQLTEVPLGTLVEGVEVFSADATMGETGTVKGGDWDKDYPATIDKTIGDGVYVIDDETPSVFNVTDAPEGNYTIEYDLSFEPGFVAELIAEENAPIAGLTIGAGDTDGTYNWYRADSDAETGWSKLDQPVTPDHYIIRMAFTDSTVTYSVKGDEDAAFTTLKQTIEETTTSAFPITSSTISSVSFKGSSKLAKFGAKTDDVIDTTIALDSDSQLIDSAEDIVTALSNGKTVTLKTNVSINTSTLDAGTYTINGGFKVRWSDGEKDRIISYAGSTLTIGTDDVKPANGYTSFENYVLRLDPTKTPEELKLSGVAPADNGKQNTLTVEIKKVTIEDETTTEEPLDPRPGYTVNYIATQVKDGVETDKLNKVISNTPQIDLPLPDEGEVQYTITVEVVK